MAIREHVFDCIRRVFRRHGSVSIDTPVFELRHILTGKYGEDSSKLIYNLEDQGGEICSLRYDLTVPFARFLAMNRQFRSLKRYHIGKVYRRDQPAITRGRLREFYQCDFDIAGESGAPLVPDAEVVAVICEILQELEIPDFQVKINSRPLLESFLQYCGVPESMFKSVCSSIDKLDKTPWSEVEHELVYSKNLDQQVAMKIKEFVQIQVNDPSVLLPQFKDKLGQSGIQALKDMETLFSYFESFGIDTKKIILDLSLARGLDYYTGMIMEAVLVGEAVGSVAGGGRYDNLVGMFSGNQSIPCVGASVGVERIFSVLESKMKDSRPSSVQVYVACAGSVDMKTRIRICSMLWKGGLNATFCAKMKPRLLDQFAHCEHEKIPIVVILGENELAAQNIRIKMIQNREDKGTLVPIDSLIDTLNLKMDELKI